MIPLKWFFLRTPLALLLVSAFSPILPARADTIRHFRLEGVTFEDGATAVGVIGFNITNPGYQDVDITLRRSGSDLFNINDSNLSISEPISNDPSVFSWRHFLSFSPPPPHIDALQLDFFGPLNGSGLQVGDTIFIIPSFVLGTSFYGNNVAIGTRLTDLTSGQVLFTSITTDIIPEPSSILLLATGVLFLGLLKLRPKSLRFSKQTK